MLIADFKKFRDFPIKTSQWCSIVKKSKPNFTFIQVVENPQGMEFVTIGMILVNLNKVRLYTF